MSEIVLWRNCSILSKVMGHQHKEVFRTVRLILYLIKLVANFEL